VAARGDLEPAGLAEFSFDVVFVQEAAGAESSVPAVLMASEARCFGVAASEPQCSPQSRNRAVSWLYLVLARTFMWGVGEDELYAFVTADLATEHLAIDSEGARIEDPYIVHRCLGCRMPGLSTSYPLQMLPMRLKSVG
jgi:hypothetical protein